MLNPTPMDVDDEQPDGRPAPQLKVAYPESDEDFEQDDESVSSEEDEDMTPGERRNRMAHRAKMRRKREARKNQPPPKEETEWGRCLRHARMTQRMLRRDVAGEYRDVTRPPRYSDGEEAFMRWGYYAYAHLQHLWRERDAREDKGGHEQAPVPWDRSRVEPFRLPPRPDQAHDAPHAAASAQLTTLDLATPESADTMNARAVTKEPQPLEHQNMSTARTTPRETSSAANPQSGTNPAGMTASLTPASPGLPSSSVPATSSATLQGT